MLLFWLLLMGAGACVVLLRINRDWAWPTAVSLLALTLLIWIVLRPQLPFTATFLPWSASGFLPDWTWNVDTSSWGLTAWLLLSGTVVSLQSLVQKTNLAHNSIAPTTVLLLMATALSAVWSNSFTGLLAGLTLLFATWLVTLWLAGERSRSFLFKAGVLLLGLLLAWPVGSSRVGLVAAALLLNVWPLPLWQPKSAESETAVAILTPLLPPLAGALILLRLLPVAQLSPAVSLLLTVLGLVGFMRGVQLAWNRLHLPKYAVTALLLAQSHLLLLSAIWVGTAGVMAELRVLLLAGGALYLVADQPAGHRLMRLAVAGVTLAALAGLPLTAGFVSRAGLYGIWIADGRWALVLVLALLHVPLIVAAGWLLRQPFREPQKEAPERRVWLREGLPVLPVLGLVSVSNLALSAISILAWLPILLSALVALFSLRLVGNVQQVRLTIRQALGSERLTWAKKLPTVQQIGAGLQTAVNDAADILDDDSGLLWLVLLVVIIILTG